MKTVLRAWALLMLCLSLDAATVKTTQIVHPLPFSQFDYLGFEPWSNRFIAFGKDFQPPIDKVESRPYQFAVASEQPDSASMQLLPGTTVLLFENSGPSMIVHMFHLLEHLVGLWSFDLYAHALDVNRIVLVADGSFDTSGWRGPNQINEHLVRALFPNAEVQSWHQFKAECDAYQRPILFERALTSDRSLCGASPICSKINKMLGEALPELDPERLNAMADQVHDYANTVPVGSKRLRVTYTQRGPPRTLAPELEKQFIAMLRAIPGVELKIVNFATLSFQQQINCIGNTDLLIGVHGMGLTHLLFLPEDAAVIEIFPPGCHHLDYRLFADARELDYYGIIAERGLIDRKTAYREGAFGCPGHGISKLDLRLIRSIVKEIVGFNPAARAAGVFGLVDGVDGQDSSITALVHRLAY